MTEAEARTQWRSIRQRIPLARQVSFLPVETLLSYGLFYLLNPHSFGGGNIDRAPPEAMALASTFKRSAGSITNKMLNLDGSRTNSARHEPELFIRLQEPGAYEPLYRRAVKAARLEGFTAQEVPDFLGAVDHDDQIELLGQDELGSLEAASALDKMFGKELAVGASFRFTETETSKLVEQRVRLVQHRFAQGVLTNYRWLCGFCGFTPGRLREYGLLIASHVKPWARSSDRERADVSNGICACPAHDKAFDVGLVTVTTDLKLKRAALLDTHMAGNETLEKVFGDQGMKTALIVPAAARKPRSEYLAGFERLAPGDQCSQPRQAC